MQAVLHHYDTSCITAVLHVVLHHYVGSCIIPLGYKLYNTAVIQGDITLPNSTKVTIIHPLNIIKYLSTVKMFLNNLRKQSVSCCEPGCKVV